MIYRAKVKVKIEDPKTGKMKPSSEVYDVNAESVTEVHAIVTKEYFGVNFDWELVSVSDTKVIKVLSATDRADR